MSALRNADLGRMRVDDDHSPPRRMSFEVAVSRIMAARSFAELAGGRAAHRLGHPVTSAVDDGAHAYRIWAKLVHPDAVGAARRASATEAFARLSALYNGRLQGSGDVPRIKNYRLDKVFASGDIAEIYADGGNLVKIPRDPGDSDLIEAEAAALRRLWRNGDPRFRPYAPRLVESFVHEDDHHRRRAVNVIERQPDMLAVSEMRPDLRQSVWIWRRLLVALGWAHRAGVVHGGILESHILVQPEKKGLVVVDWCYAGHRPQAIVKAREADYPPEVLHEKTATPATDIFMATRLMTRLMGTEMPHGLRNFAAGCCYDAPRMRPQDAWALLAEFDEIIPPRYRN